MNNSISWLEPQPRLTRGCAIDAVVAASDDATLSRAFEEAWCRVSDVVKGLRDPERTTSVTVEIWQDTGRVIYVVKQKRDLARIVITCSEIEQQYFSFPRSHDSFERDYTTQHQRLVRLVRATFPSSVNEFLPREMFEKRIEVAIRDSDDSSTTEAIV